MYVFGNVCKITKAVCAINKVLLKAFHYKQRDEGPRVTLKISLTCKNVGVEYVNPRKIKQRQSEQKGNAIKNY